MEIQSQLMRGLRYNKWENDDLVTHQETQPANKPGSATQDRRTCACNHHHVSITTLQAHAVLKQTDSPQNKNNEPLESLEQILDYNPCFLDGKVYSWRKQRGLPHLTVDLGYLMLHESCLHNFITLKDNLGPLWISVGWWSSGVQSFKERPLLFFFLVFIYLSGWVGP